MLDLAAIFQAATILDAVRFQGWLGSGRQGVRSARVRLPVQAAPVGEEGTGGSANSLNVSGRSRRCSRSVPS
ncbi:MAG: hypothetical protein WC058_05320, partial [Phycisphaeraceae bacterium]